MIQMDSIPVLTPADVELKKATKTKPIKAKPINALIADKGILAKFLLATLEGNQVLRANSMVCIGADNDAWQQTPEKLLKKYKVESIDEDGWMVCHPYPDNEVLAGEVEGVERFTIHARWGQEQIVDGKQVFVQHGKAGDFIVRNTSDENDMWIVERKMFLSTYEWMK